MIHDQHIRKLIDFSNSKDCFPTVDIAGGLCYFLWDSNNTGECEVTNVTGNERHTMTRKLDSEGDILIRSNVALSILRKIKAKTTETYQSQVLPRNPFDFGSGARGKEEPFENCIKLIHSKGVGYVSRDEVRKNADLIDKYKVYISPLVPCNGEVGIDPAKGYKSITTPRIMMPGEIGTDSYIVIGAYDSLEMAELFSNYMMCKLPRYMLRITYSSMHVGWQNFRYVPKLDLTMHWDDKKLYEYFALDEAEITVIEKTMRTITKNTKDDE